MTAYNNNLSGSYIFLYIYICLKKKIYDFYNLYIHTDSCELTDIPTRILCLSRAYRYYYCRSYVTYESSVRTYRICFLGVHRCASFWTRLSRGIWQIMRSANTTSAIHICTHTYVYIHYTYVLNNVKHSAINYRLLDYYNNYIHARARMKKIKKIIIPSRTYKFPKFFGCLINYR